jgi:hypothetical protein
MRLCFVKKLHLWPRYHESVISALGQLEVEMVELEQELTESMGLIQNDLINIMDACLVEVRKTNKIDLSELTLEGALHTEFDQVVKRQLQPVWHKVGLGPTPNPLPNPTRGLRLDVLSPETPRYLDACLAGGYDPCAFLQARSMQVSFLGKCLTGGYGGWRRRSTLAIV